MDSMSEIKPNTLMTLRGLRIKATFSLWSYMHLLPGNWVAIGHTVMYYARVAHTFNAGIKFLRCILILGVEGVNVNFGLRFPW